MLDKSVVKQLIDNCGLNDAVPVIYAKELQDFAQAIYELGVKDERERCANICYEFDTRQGIRALGFSVAEAIRKGE